MRAADLTLAALLLLSGCAAATVEPYAVEIADASQYEADLKICAGYAKAYQKGLDFTGVGAGAVKGAAANIGDIAVNPYTPLLGAAGGAANELLNALEILDTKQRSVFLTCLSKKTERDRSALVLESE